MRGKQPEPGKNDSTNHLTGQAEPSQTNQSYSNNDLIGGTLVSAAIIVLPVVFALGSILLKKFREHRRQLVLHQQINLLERIWLMSPNNIKNK